MKRKTPYRDGTMMALRLLDKETSKAIIHELDLAKIEDRDPCLAGIAGLPEDVAEKILAEFKYAKYINEVRRIVGAKSGASRRASTMRDSMGRYVSNLKRGV